jgi:Fe-S cluster assembly protein SufD
VALRVPSGVAVEKALLFGLSGPGHVRVLLVLEAGASLTLLEANETVGPRNAGVEIVLGAGAALEHVRIEQAGDAVQVEEIAVSLAANARYRAHFANFGSKLSRTELHIVLDGEGAETRLSGVSVLNGRHADVTSFVTHAVGNTQSTQLFKYVAGGHARGVYQGKVTVAHGANGSDSRQTAKGLLLEDRAEIDLKPELEILADDVKCAHGAAVGDLDAESLFYLRSRGIPEAEARALLMRAFLGDAVDEIEDEGIRASVWAKVEEALVKATEATP